MKFFHIADLHIGKIVNGFNMLEEQRVVFDQIISMAKDEKPDGLLIAGDVYDRTIPSAEAVELLNHFLTKISQLKINIFLVSGNHDSPERLSFAKEILKKHRVYISGTLEKEIEKITLQKEGEKQAVHLYLLPFAKIPVMNYAFGIEEKTYNDCMKAVIEKMNLNREEINILVTHHFVTNGKIKPEVSDSEPELNVGGIEQIDCSILEPFDYVALGHIHGAQWIGRETIRYSGSPLKYSFSEVHHHKTVTVIEVKDKHNINITLRELKPLHDMRKMKGSLENLIADEIVMAGNPYDYIQITLTDREERIDPIGSLRAVYPNLMQLVLEKNIKTNQEEVNAVESIKKKSICELYESFYEEVTGSDMDEQREVVMKKIFEEMSMEGASTS